MKTRSAGKDPAQRLRLFYHGMDRPGRNRVRKMANKNIRRARKNPADRILYDGMAQRRKFRVREIEDKNIRSAGNDPAHRVFYYGMQCRRKNRFCESECVVIARISFIQPQGLESFELLGIDTISKLSETFMVVREFASSDNIVWKFAISWQDGE